MLETQLFPESRNPGLDTYSQHHHVRPVLMKSAAQVAVTKGNSTVFGNNFRHFPFYEANLLVTFKPYQVLFPFFFLGSSVDVEYGNLLGISSFKRQHGLLEGNEAADLGAIRPVLSNIPGADTLHEGNFPGRRSVGYSGKFPASGTRGAEKAFKLERRQYVRAPVVIVIRYLRRIKGAKPRRVYDSPDFKGDNIILLIKFYCPGRAEFLAYPAFSLSKKPARIFFNHRHSRHGLRKKLMYGPGFIQSQIKWIGNFYRALLRACSATDTPVFQNKTGQLSDYNVKIPRKSIYRFHPAVCQDIYPLTGFYLVHPWRQNTHGAVIGGKGFVEPGHVSAHRRSLLDQENFKAESGTLYGSLHPCYTTTNNENTLFHVFPCHANSAPK